MESIHTLTRAIELATTMISQNRSATKMKVTAVVHLEDEVYTETFSKFVNREVCITYLENQKEISLKQCEHYYHLCIVGYCDTCYLYDIKKVPTIRCISCDKLDYSLCLH